jgi:hypothetical protein
MSSWRQGNAVLGQLKAEAVNPMAAAVAQAGFECESLREGADRLGLQDLAGLIAGDKALQDAWERGRFLRELAELAESPVCMAGVAEQLGFDDGGFNGVLATDPEARDTWRRGRHRFYVQAKSAIMAGAGQGKPHCLRTVEAIVRAEAGGPPQEKTFDHNHLSMAEMERVTGVSRVQLLRWVERGLPRDPDSGCFSLPAFIAWLRKGDTGRRRGYRRKPGAVEKRIVERIKSVVHDELKGFSDDERRAEHT